jgi:hypothetical protein
MKSSIARTRRRFGSVNDIDSESSMIASTLFLGVQLWAALPFSEAPDVVAAASDECSAGAARARLGIGSG